MLIYYAHNINIYNTEVEQEQMAAISMAFPDDEILNPNGDFEVIKFTDCFLHIDRCGRLVFSSVLNEFLGRGVYAEIIYAKSKGLDIWWLYTDENKDYELLPLDELILRPNNVNDWKYRYARIILRTEGAPSLESVFGYKFDIPTRVVDMIQAR